MKKKIILFLTFLMVVICLTGCSTCVSKVEIYAMTQIAQEIKNNPYDYQLPDGFSYKLEDETKNTGRIILKAKDESGVNNLRITFDISKKEVEIVKIKKEYKFEVFIIIVCIAVVFTIIGVIIQKNTGKIA